jgi:hypothetical protein
MVSLSNHIASLIQNQAAVQNASIMSAAYVIAFVLPYAALKAYQHLKK